MHEIPYFISIVTGLALFMGCAVPRSMHEKHDNYAKAHLQYLSSDALGGRYPGTEGDSMARYYIQHVFLDNSVKLLFNEGFQEVPFTRSRIPGKNTSLVFNGDTLLMGKDMMPLGFSSPDTVTGQVIFAGYGITCLSGDFTWDDYAGIDAHQKWLMMLRGYPHVEGNDTLLEKYSEERDKAMLARDNGAAGLLFVSGMSYDNEDQLISFDSTASSVGIPVFHIKRAFADTLLATKNIAVSQLESNILEDKKPISFALYDTVYAISDILTQKGNTYNIAGLIEGSDPLLKNEYIVIGAHFDHLGIGGKNSSSRRPDTIAVHNGADDNASGVTAMLTLAKLLPHKHLRRSVIVVAFGAEEMGLLGSRQFVSHPPVDLKKITAMINLDMVGRLDTSKGLQVSGTGTSLEADSLIALANKHPGLKLRKTSEGFGPSDHASFYGRDIPVFFLTTGAHVDYHTPDDDIEYINFQGLDQVSGFAFRLTEAIANHPSTLHFMEAGPKTSVSSGRRFKVTLGFMPCIADDSTDGVRVEFVTRGKPAELGGIKSGDIITAINDLPIHNIYDYMYRLSKLSPGETISVEIQRNGNKEVLLIQL
ncbi:MAG: M28 family peptidase [Bacteroidales bacterium]|nr:M28 family peptidase [Bacteroidales bacterium]